MSLSEKRTQEEHAVIKETVTLTVFRYFGELLLGIRGFIIASFLGPSLYGLWNIITVTVQSAHYLGLGMPQALTREIPLNVGRGAPGNNRALMETCFAFLIGGSILFALVLICCSFTESFREYAVESRLAGILVIFNNGYIFLRQKLNGEKKLFDVARYVLMYAVFNTVFGLALLFSMKIAGLLTGMILAEALIMVIALYKNHFSPRMSFSFQHMIYLMKIGAPIMMLSMSYFLMQNIDKYIIFFMLGSTMTGYYGLASFISLLINYVPSSVSVVLMPRMMHKFGRTQDRESIEEYFTKPITIIAYSIPVALGLIFITIDIPITYVLAKYMPSLTSIKILILSLFFSVVMKVPTDILIAFNKQQVLMWMQLSVLVFGAVLDIVAVNLGFGIEGVAFATLCTFFLLSLVSTLFVLHSLRKRILFQCKTLLLVYLPFAYTVGIIYALRFVPGARDSLLLRSAMECIIFLACCLPLFKRLHTFGLFRIVWEAYRGKGGST